ncbi:MAG TPA: metal-dependent transcriptional regulator [Methanothermococcus okinawensis]|uniref:DtxR family transcriptional regulator, Mn-dependent transcriptional regulator n=1 Tax=Methanofervidicoccus abyssi TaxID=2082189 RepID=A0A401HQJ1_9EURY|nr:metal-dependent transcriptional regulator [Methanofervidicoccus abyssi]GBF36537.1 DtxR family transcriptional regulator, Mn-dependent transcriptional regulator [Methanofervidicoccus abyssi]HIP16033.1 metal-dependent transcriptional regulator [Methanothermococcus okinawensis]HIP34892.1 metal-dependent transcriptional regulator [Methanothermococcus okinawensis]
MSESIENFLEKVYLFTKDKNRPIKTTELAKLLNIKPPAVTNMAKKLHKLGYVEYEPYIGIRLTEKGIKKAKVIIDKHNIIEAFLVECLGLEKEVAYREACKLEHAMSDRVFRRFKEFVEDCIKCKKS